MYTNGKSITVSILEFGEKGITSNKISIEEKSDIVLIFVFRWYK